MRADDYCRQEPGGPDKGEEAPGRLLHHAGQVDQEPGSGSPHPLPGAGCAGAQALPVGPQARDPAGGDCLQG